MEKHSIQHLIYILFIISAFFLSGCGDSNSVNTTHATSTPDETLDSYASYLENGDINSAVAHVYEQARQEHKDSLLLFNADEMAQYANALQNAIFDDPACLSNSPKDGDLCSYTVTIQFNGQEYQTKQEMGFLNGEWYMID